MAEPITVRVPTDKSARYMTQLAKHWSHKFEVQLTETTATVPLPFGLLTMQAEPDAIVGRFEPTPEADLKRLKEVFENHLNRFAFREGELVYEWSA